MKKTDRKTKADKKNNQIVDEASLESFPASDPPSWTGSITGSARKNKPKKVKKQASGKVKKRCAPHFITTADT